MPEIVSVINISAYRFVALTETALPDYQQRLKTAAEAVDLKGTILLSQEGINLFLAGPRRQIASFWAILTAEKPFVGMEYRESASDRKPFKRMLVKIRREIITFNRPEVDPINNAAPRISAQTLKKWLDEGKDFVLLDTRNAFEVDFGTFKNARHLNISAFRQFPDVVKNQSADWREKPVVTFCTGGIRCEKAAPFMLQNGFSEVYQLEGGILKYFEETKGTHWEGECFVFDERVGVDGELSVTGAILCDRCARPLSKKDQKAGRFCADCSD